MMFRTQITALFTSIRNHPRFWAVSALSVALLFVLVPETAYAQADVGRKLLGYIMEPFVSFFALLVYAGGVALNASAYFSIVQMGNLVNGSSGLATAWGLFRDLGNIVVVFGFIAIGIATILDIGQYNAKKMLGTLLVVAILMNFSSLVARGVIDVGNVVGLQFYKAINGNELPSGSVFGGGISDQFMQAVGLQGIYDAGALYKTYEDRVGDHFFTFSLLIIILFTITAFVFFSIAFLFIARFVILTLLITISPLAFAAMAIPRFSSMTGKWWNLLINNTLVAPAVLLMLLVSLKVVQDDNFMKMTAGAKWVDTGAASWAYLILSFGIVCGFFLASLLIAKQFSAFGASFATNMGGKLAFGAAGFAARQTVGRGGAAASRAFRRTAVGQSELGRLATKYTFDKVGAASFDGRSGFGATALKGMGIDAGKGQKGGRVADVKETNKARLEYSQSLGQTAAQKKKQDELEAEADNEKKTYEAGQEAREEEKERAKKAHEDKKSLIEQGTAANLAPMKQRKQALEREEIDLQEQKELAQRDLETARATKDQQGINRATNSLTSIDTSLSDTRNALRSVTEKITATNAEKESLVSNLKQSYDAETKRIQEEIEEAKKTHLAEAKRIQEEIKEAETAHIEKYAQSLEKPADVLKKIGEATRLNKITGTDATMAGAALGTTVAGPLGTVVGGAVGASVRSAISDLGSTGRAAAKSIRDKAKMSTTEKMLEDIKKELDENSGDKKGSKKDDEEGGE